MNCELRSSSAATPFQANRIYHVQIFPQISERLFPAIAISGESIASCSPPIRSQQHEFGLEWSVRSARLHRRREPRRLCQLHGYAEGLFVRDDPAWLCDIRWTDRRRQARPPGYNKALSTPRSRIH